MYKFSNNLEDMSKLDDFEGNSKLFEEACSRNISAFDIGNDEWDDDPSNDLADNIQRRLNVWSSEETEDDLDFDTIIGQLHFFFEIRFLIVFHFFVTTQQIRGQLVAKIHH